MLHLMLLEKYSFIMGPSIHCLAFARWYLHLISEDCFLYSAVCMAAASISAVNFIFLFIFFYFPMAESRFDISQLQRGGWQPSAHPGLYSQ